MPKKAPEQETVDPVRARLAGVVAAPTKTEPRKAAPKSVKPKTTQKLKRMTQSVPERASVNRKFMVTEAEAERMAEVTHNISKTFGGKVGHSLITRALWTVLGDMEERIKRFGDGESRSLPSTGDADAQAEYEVAVYEMIRSIVNRGG